eukprot:scaffold1187_cov258-Pinguiococcus_pyrenoidosus.AAC.16
MFSRSCSCSAVPLCRRGVPVWMVAPFGRRGALRVGLVAAASAGTERQRFWSSMASHVGLGQA